MNIGVPRAPRDQNLFGFASFGRIPGEVLELRQPIPLELLRH